jgi:NADH-quinone oxidoreductase subunit M
MVNHGIATGLLFIVVGMLTARGGSKLISDYGGVWKVAPILGGMFLIASLATIAMPGTNSFISEFLVLIGTFTRYPVWSVIATIGIVLAAVYMLWIFQRTMTGPVRGFGVLGGAHSGDDFGLDSPTPVPVGAPQAAVEGGGAHHRAELTSEVVTEPVHAAGHHAPSRIRAKFGDLTAREITVLTPLVVLIIVLGVYPQPVLDVINPTAERTMVDVGQSDPPPAIDAPIVGGN